jgi:hypothetical protein
MSLCKDRAIYCHLVAGRSVAAVALAYAMPAGAIEKIYDHGLLLGVRRAAEVVEPPRGIFPKRRAA